MPRPLGTDIDTERRLLGVGGGMRLCRLPLPDLFGCFGKRGMEPDDRAVRVRHGTIVKST